MYQDVHIEFISRKGDVYCKTFTGKSICLIRIKFYCNSYMWVLMAVLSCWAMSFSYQKNSKTLSSGIKFIFMIIDYENRRGLAAYEIRVCSGFTLEHQWLLMHCLISILLFYFMCFIYRLLFFRQERLKCESVFIWLV